MPHLILQEQVSFSSDADLPARFGLGSSIYGRHAENKKSDPAGGQG